MVSLQSRIEYHRESNRLKKEKEIMRLEAGKFLGDWKLLKEIGSSAIGTSIVAEHRFTKQKAVLKILPEELSSDRSFVMRFEEEAMVLATLDHPNIAKMYTVSFVDGRYFLVVDCVVDAKQELTNLQQLVKDTSLTDIQILQIAEQVASALDYAHTLKTYAGLSRVKFFAHGSLNPSHILISTQEDALASSRIHIKIADFGLSRIVGQGAWFMRSTKALFEQFCLHESRSAAEDQGFVARATLKSLQAIQASSESASNTMTALATQRSSPQIKSTGEAAAQIAQTLMFLSPEQRKGDWSTPVESDNWSFGVLLYWLISRGKYPEGMWDISSFQSLHENIAYTVIRDCLLIDPIARPKSLIPLLIDAKNKVVEKEELSSVPESPKPHLPDVVVQEAPHVVEEPAVAPLPVEESSSNRSIKEYVPERRDVKVIEPILSDMVSVRAGTYLRGSTHGCRDEIPRHEIRLNAFQIDIHPVTNEQFVRFMEFVGDEKDSYNHDIIRLRDSRIKKNTGRFVIERGYSKHPVVGVTWYGAQAYASWIHKRLPTEAEWEIACCGGLDNPPYPTGEDIERSQANFFSSDTTPVMSYPPNGYGLYDFPGNVYEWCQDWYEYNYYDFSVMEPDNPKGPVQGVYRVLRGGCWKSLKEDLRCSKRHRNNPGTANGTYGFRCAVGGE